MTRRLAILGAGVMGRWMAYLGLQKGWQVSLFDQRSISQLPSSPYPTSFIAGGMCAPFSEWEKAEDRIVSLGLKSLPLWRQLNRQLPTLDWRESGTLIVAHPQERGEFQRFQETLEKKQGQSSDLFPELTLQTGNPHQWEEQLDRRFSQSLLLNPEGHVDPKSFFQSTNDYFAQQVFLGHMKLYEHHLLQSWGQGKVATNQGAFFFDRLFSTLGFHDKAKDNFPTIRGVRGEVLRLKAPGVKLTRPVRLLHPRYPIYVIPRSQQEFLVGATQIETEDLSPISVRSALELLSTTYTLHSGFAEASILDHDVGLRPTLPDHLPHVFYDKQDPTYFAVNGLYRHGYLCAPALAEEVLNL
jgi:glycine oxidase